MSALTTVQHSALGDLYRFGHLFPPPGGMCNRGTPYGFSTRTLNALVAAGLATWRDVYRFPAIVPTCAVCSEPITRGSRGHWSHMHGDTYCGTGDGATATPRV